MYLWYQWKALHMRTVLSDLPAWQILENRCHHEQKKSRSESHNKKLMWSKLVGLYYAFSLNEMDHHSVQIQWISGSGGPSAAPGQQSAGSLGSVTAAVSDGVCCLSAFTAIPARLWAAPRLLNPFQMSSLRSFPEQWSQNQDVDVPGAFAVALVSLFLSGFWRCGIHFAMKQSSLCNQVTILLPCRHEGHHWLLCSQSARNESEGCCQAVTEARRPCWLAGVSELRQGQSRFFTEGVVQGPYWYVPSVWVTALGHNSLAFLYIAVKIAAVRETRIRKRGSSEKWDRCLLVGIPQCIVTRIPEHVERNMGYLVWLLSTWFHTWAALQGCRDLL